MLQGWKAFRTLEGHTSNPRTQEKDWAFDHEKSVVYPLNQAVHPPPKSTRLWFCRTKQRACEWAQELGYRYIAPVEAPHKQVFQVGHSDPETFCTTELTRVGDMQPSNASVEKIVACAAGFMDLPMVLELVAAGCSSDDAQLPEEMRPGVQIVLLEAFLRNDWTLVDKLVAVITPGRVAECVPAWQMIDSQINGYYCALPHAYDFLNKLHETFSPLSSKPWLECDRRARHLFTRSIAAVNQPMCKWIFEHFPKYFDMSRKTCKQFVCNYTNSLLRRFANASKTEKIPWLALHDWLTGTFGLLRYDPQPPFVSKRPAATSDSNNTSGTS